MLRWTFVIGSVLGCLTLGAEEAPCANPVLLVEFEVTGPNSTAVVLADEDGLILDVATGTSSVHLQLTPVLPSSQNQKRAKIEYKATYSFGSPDRNSSKSRPGALIGESTLRVAFNSPVPLALPEAYRVVPLRFVSHCSTPNSLSNNLLGGGNCCLSTGEATICGCEVFAGGRYCCGTRCCPSQA